LEREVCTNRRRPCRSRPFRPIWSCLGPQIVALGLLIAFPQIALWLPSTIDR